MKSNEILKAIGLAKSKYNTAHCSKLAIVYSLLKEVKGEIISAEIVGSEELFFGKQTRINDWNNEITDNEGQIIKAQKIKVVTSYGGVYSFAIPIENAFYYAILDLLGIAYNVASFTPASYEKIVVAESGVYDAIKKAAKFTSNDDLRPSWECVLVEVEGEEIRVRGCDGHRLYLSPSIPCITESSEAFSFLLTKESVAKLSSVKAEKGASIEILITGENTALIDGIECSLYNGTKYPDYKAVIPTYDTSMVFDRKSMISNVKKVMPYSNKSTAKVNFHLNGKIEMMAEDRDFEFGTTASFPYVSKDFQDTDIAFNGKFLVETLGVFKSSEVSMLHNGIPTKPAIFTDGSERVLVCPLMIKD